MTRRVSFLHLKQATRPCVLIIAGIEKDGVVSPGIASAEMV